VLESLAESGKYGERDDQRHDPRSDADNGDQGDDGDHDLLALGSEVSAGYEKFEHGKRIQKSEDRIQNGLRVRIDDSADFFEQAHEFFIFTIVKIFGQE
jgi:hypothetical protein